MSAEHTLTEEDIETVQGGYQGEDVQLQGPRDADSTDDADDTDAADADDGDAADVVDGDAQDADAADR